MADSTNYILNLIITANNKATEQINKLGESVDTVKKNVVQLSDSTKKTLKTIGTTATVVAGGMVALGKSFVDAAMEIEPVKNAYKQLTDSVGEDSDKMLDSLRKASKGAVKDYDLMLAANTSMKLGVATNTEDLTDLMKIARLYGQQMGQDVTSSFDDIVRGLGRGSAQILDNLGIVVDSEKAYADYAEQLGKTANELTNAEQKQAIVNATLIEGRRALEEFGEPEATMAERMKALGYEFERIKVTVGEALLPVIERLAEKITPIIEKIADWINEHPKLTANIMIAITAISGLIAVVSGLALALPAISTAIGVLSGPIGRLIGAIALVATARANNRGGIQEKTQIAVDHITEIIKPRLDKLQERRNKHGETIMIYVEEVFGAVADTIGTVLSGIAVFIAGTFDDIESLFKLRQAIWSEDREEVLKIATERATNIDNLLTEAFGETRTNIKEGIQEFVDRVVEKFNRLYDQVTAIVNKIKNMREGAKQKVSGRAEVAETFITGKASGGDVYSGTPYMVGEHGPELFVPNQRGSIVPTNQITNNNGIEINMSGITVRSEADIQLIAEEITRRIKLEKDYGIIS